MKGLVLLSTLALLFILLVAPALAQTGTVVATVRPNPLEVSILAPSTVSVGQWFDLSADVSNLGGEVVSKTVATLNAPQDVSVRGSKKRIGDLAGGQTKTVTWQVKANNPGDFIVQVEVTGVLAGEQISQSSSKLISAIGTLGAFLARLLFGV